MTPRPSHSPLLAALVAVAACTVTGPETADDTIARDSFIEAYVDLRVTALRSPDGELDDSERAEVLARRRVTEEELLHFAEAHATNAEYMRDVWAEIERRLEEEPLEPPPGR